MIKLIVILLLLTGCAGVFDKPFVPEFDRGPDTPKHVTYVDTPDEMAALCGPPAYRKIDWGCARVPRSADGVCIIVLYRNGPAWATKEEFDHCRYGAFHP